MSTSNKKHLIGLLSFFDNYKYLGQPGHVKTPSDAWDTRVVKELDFYIDKGKKLVGEEGLHGATNQNWTAMARLGVIGVGAALVGESIKESVAITPNLVVTFVAADGTEDGYMVRPERRKAYGVRKNVGGRRGNGSFGRRKIAEYTGGRRQQQKRRVVNGRRDHANSDRRVIGYKLPDSILYHHGR